MKLYIIVPGSNVGNPFKVNINEVSPCTVVVQKKFTNPICTAVFSTPFVLNISIKKTDY